MDKDNYCFGCGTENPNGLHLVVEEAVPGEVWAACVVPRHLQGYHRIVHGGILATLLDEIMAHAAFRCVTGPVATARMEITFRSPVRVEEPIRVEGRIESVRGKLVRTRGRLITQDGQTAAEASATFFRLPDHAGGEGLGTRDSRLEARDSGFEADS